MNNELKEYCLGIIDDLQAIVAGEDEECATLYDYLAECLDVEYTTNSRKDCLGARIAITLGGPSVYLNSRYGTIEGAWGQDRFQWSLPETVAAELDEVVDEWWRCLDC